MSTPYISKNTKKNVRSRAKSCCEYCRCQEDFSPQPFSIEHILPLAKNGSSEVNNLALSCQGCNNLKGVKTENVDSLSKKSTPIFNPRTQIWEEHFKWNEDFSLVIGLTNVGRATLDLLQLNRSGVVNLRKVLHRYGEHPPPL